MTRDLACLGSHPAHGRIEWRAPFLATDAGRSTSRRPRQKNDCTVRALALATGSTYDEAYEALAAAGRKCAGRFHFGRWAKDATFNGHRFVWRPFPAIKGELRMNPVRFAMANPKGSFILRVSKHVLAAVDGVLMDDSAEQGSSGLEWRCVYGAWEAVCAST